MLVVIVIDMAMAKVNDRRNNSPTHTYHKVQ